MGKKLFNEFTLPHQIFEDSKFAELKLSSKFLYCYLAKLRNRYANNEGWFWRSEDTLSKETNLHKNTIHLAKKELKKTGLIETKRGHYVSTGNRAPDWFKLNGYVS